jgi:hypothetical protein
MEHAITQIEEAVRKDKDETRKPKPEMIAMIDMDNLQEFRPVLVYFN